MNRLITHKIITPLTALLKQGLTPESLAFSFSMGLVIAVFPVFGITTVLCILAAAVFKLNQLSTQIANYCGYPLQFILFIPLIRMGETLFGLDPVSIDPVLIFQLARDDFSEFLHGYGAAILAGCVVWLILAIPAIFLISKILAYLLRLKMRSV